MGEVKDKFTYLDLAFIKAHTAASENLQLNVSDCCLLKGRCYAFGTGYTAGRASALRKVAESNSIKQAEFSPAFVLLQYFGYLRRNPTDAPDTDNSGYQFWLRKLNSFG